MTNCNRRGFRAALMIGVSAMLLASCQTRQTANSMPKLMDQYTAKARSAALPAPEVHAVLNDSAEPYWGGSAVLSDHGEPLPEKWEVTDAVKLSTEGQVPLTLYEIAARITQMTSVQVRLTDGAGSPPVYRQPSSGGTKGQQGQQGGASAQSPVGQTGGLPPQLGLLQQASAVGGSGAMMGSQAPETMTVVDYHGTLSSLLNTVSARFGVSWIYRDGVVKMYRYRSRTFVFPTTPGTISLQASAGTSGTGGSGGGSGTSGAAGAGATGAGGTGTSSSSLGSSSQSVNAQADLNYFDHLKEKLEVMLPLDGQVALSPDDGEVTIMAPEDSLQRVSEYVEGEIKSASRQAAINVRIYSIDATNGEDYSLNWVMDYAGKNGLNFNITGPTAPGSGAVTGLGGATVGVLSPSSGLGQFSGSSVTVNALASETNATVKTDVSMVVRNNWVQPWNDLVRTTYVGQSTNTTTVNVGSTTGLTPATADSGYSFVLMPRISDDGGIWLFFANRITALTALKSSADQGTQIQLPTEAEQSGISHFHIRSGTTLVIAGIAQDTDSANANGVGSPWLPIFGGGIQGAKEKRRLIYMFTATEIDTMAQPVDQANGRSL